MAYKSYSAGAHAMRQGFAVNPNTGPTSAQRVAAAEEMHGTGSRQHEAAKAAHAAVQAHANDVPAKGGKGGKGGNPNHDEHGRFA